MQKCELAAISFFVCFHLTLNRKTVFDKSPEFGIAKQIHNSKAGLGNFFLIIFLQNKSHFSGLIIF